MLDEAYWCEAVMASSEKEACKAWNEQQKDNSAFVTFFKLCYYRNAYYYNAIMLYTHGGY